MAGGQSVGWLALITFLLAFSRTQAQPTIVSTVPASGATGVSTTAAVVFTFSQAMNPSETEAIFFNDSTFTEYTTTAAWSAGNTVLSCTPSPAFPGNAEILWDVGGQSAGGTALGGTIQGTFTTGAGVGGSGTAGTNQYTAFAIGEAIYYDQTTNAPPSLQTSIPAYVFYADVTLSSNQSALSATLELPSTVVTNLGQTSAPGQYLLEAFNSSQTVLTNTFGNGNYVFMVNGSSSNEQVTINLPSTSTLPQPPAPQISNYVAAQSINPAQAFTLIWDPFVGGTAADTIYLTVGSVFGTPQPTVTNALPGTATSVVIPANTLLPGSNYDCFISFYHLILPTNTLPAYTTAAYRYAATEFNISTASAATMPIVLTNAARSGHTISFNVTSAIGQSLIIQYTTNSLVSTQWQTLLATTNTTGVVQVSDSVNTTNQHVYYRAQTGP